MAAKEYKQLLKRIHKPLEVPDYSKLHDLHIQFGNFDTFVEPYGDDYSNIYGKTLGRILTLQTISPREYGFASIYNACHFKKINLNIGREFRNNSFIIEVDLIRQEQDKIVVKVNSNRSNWGLDKEPYYSRSRPVIQIWQELILEELIPGQAWI